ncbi:GNAT family N-acetyltransferase [Streptomyces carminius]|uniref:GNAT family N-acetyltransferase n=1 Tax=Streptomyces carminius TaxID=2665496 RepID=A0A2M8LT37_9ACTN|nr:bifunctional GNAT family N-acetyltransferase/acetate--CoA ligase family protein [Streptomyces carminius]PJE95120.1 GNAT family N-acetyltransferase [Streptomyces carminius]
MTDTAEHVRQAHALLADGRTVEIRPARPEDRLGVEGLYARMSPESLRWRFPASGPGPGRQAARRVCGPARPGCLALLALYDGRVVGVAEYEGGRAGEAGENGENGGSATPVAGGAPVTTAEVALAVADDFRHHGVGTLLLEHLVHAARAEGVTAFTAGALAGNHAVLRVFADLGLRTTRRLDGGEVRCEILLDPDEHYLASVDERGRTADAASLRPLLRPRSIAVVGAGRAEGSVGRAVLRNLHRAGFTGRLLAVNPHASVVERTPCYPSVAVLPKAPELAVLTVPAHAVPETARQCGKSGVRALVVLTSGLDAEQGAALLATCRHYGMRLVGPNCLGIANTEDGIRLDATFAAHRPLPGSAGVAVQSGGVGIALLGGLARLGIGVSSFVSLGDKYDVSGNDLLQWWEGDGRTDLALLHLESFGNPRAFSRTARRVARHMPVLTVDAGRSAAGRRAAASHTAAAATPTMTRRALFTQAGVIATRSIGELLDAAALLHSQPLPTGSRVAVVSNAGGAGVLAADACVEAGLTVPELPAALAAELGVALPAGAAAGNPVDTTAAVGGTELAACLDRLARRSDIDAVLVVLVPTATVRATGDDPVRALLRTAGDHPAKTFAAVLPDQGERVRLLPTGHPDGSALPVYADPQDAARALARAVERTRWLGRPSGTVPEIDGLTGTAHAAARDAARALVAGFLAEHPGGGWLDPRHCARLLDLYGVLRLPQIWAGNEDAAVAAAAALSAAGGPEGPDGSEGPDGRVALKAHWPGLVHKSDQGAVVLDLAGEHRVRAAWRELTARLGDVMTGAVVQPMARRGTELVAGVVQDEVFGPLVLFGLGGTATDVLADHAARLAPLTDRDVRDLLTAPRCAPLLFGHRGGPPADLDGLEQTLLRLSTMACDLPELAEAEINPLLARPDGVTAVDARVRLLPRRAHDPHLRRLR